MKNRILLQSFFCLIILIIGNGCAFNFGNYFIRDNDFRGAIDPEYYALEGVTPPFLNEKIEVSLGTSWQPSKFEGGTLSTTTGSIHKVSTSFYELYALVHYFPFGINSDKFAINSKGLIINPYIGTGINYFNYYITHNEIGALVGGDWLFNYYEIDSKSRTLSHGYNPCVSIGVYIPLKDWGGWKLGMLLEDRFDFQKSDNGIDFSGHIFSVGIRLDPWY